MTDHGIPPIYDPPLSDEVTAFAEKTAAKLLADNDYGNDWPLLYRHVRTIMNRRAVCDKDHPTLDDESISAGIVNAINAN